MHSLYANVSGMVSERDGEGIMATWCIEYRPKEKGLTKEFKPSTYEWTGKLSVVFDTRREARSYYKQSGNHRDFFFRAVKCVDVLYDATYKD